MPDQPCVVVSPCGTSILTNGADPEIRELLVQHANLTEDELTRTNDKERLDQHIEERSDEIRGVNASAIGEWSAELNGIIRLYGGVVPRNCRDQHFLISTDTYLGRKATDLVRRWMSDHALRVDIPAFGGLRTSRVADFNVAVADLVRWCHQLAGLEGYRQAHYRIIFNLTGGFKSIQGVLQVLGMLLADECVYVFESGEELLRVPRLPIALDPAGVIGGHLSVFRRLAIEDRVRLDECAGIPETLLLVVDDEVTLSTWGALLWEQSRKGLLGDQLLQPLTNRIRFGPSFHHDVSHLESDRLVLVNERLDDLARFVLSNGDDNPSRLDHRPLKGDPLPPATHECNAWSDQDARRIFMHRDGGVWVLDRLCPGLH